MDFSSDFDQSLSHIRSEDSDTEGHLFIEQDLRDQINHLTQQNTVLKAQFEQAVETSKQMNEVVQKNSILSQQLRSIQYEKDSLENRLNLSLKTNEDLTKKIEEERASTLAQITQIESQKDLEILNASKQCKSKIEAMSLRVRQVEDLKEQIETKNKALVAKIDKAVQEITNYFCVSFDSIDSVISFLQQPPAVVDNRNCDQNYGLPNDDQQQGDHKHCKKKIRSLKKHCEKFVSEINKLQNDLSQAESRHSNEVKSYQIQLKQLKEELADKAANKENQCLQLEKHNKTLTNEIKKLRKDVQQQQNAQCLSFSVSSQQNLKDQEQQMSFSLLSQQQQKQSIVPQNEKPANRQISDLKENNASLTQENNDLLQKIKDLDKSKAEISAKLKDAMYKNTELQMKINQLENEKRASSVIHAETLNELQSVREILHSKDKPNNNKNKDKKLDKLQKRYSQLEQSSKTQQGIIQSQELKIQNYKTENETLQTKISNSKKEVIDLQNHIKSLNEEIAEANEKIANKPELTIDDILPPNSLRFKGFDPVLSDKIESVIGSVFSPAIKLNKIYSLIYNYYNTIIEEKTNSVDHMAEHLQCIKDKLNKFFIDLSLALSMEPITFEDFVDRGKNGELLSTVSQCYRGYEDLKRKNHELNLVYNRFVEEFGQSTDIPTYITTIRHNFENQTNQLKQQIRKNKEIKKCTRIYKKNMEAKVASLEDQNSHLCSKLYEHKTTNEELTTKLQSVKCELQSIKAEYEMAKASSIQSENEEENVDNENSQIFLQKMSQHHKKEIISLNRQIETMKKEIDELNDIISEKENVINRQKNIISQQKNEITEKTQEFSSFKDKEDEYQRKYQTEKSQLVQTYENAISEIQKRCGDQRSDVEKLSNELLTTQNKLKQAQGQISKLKKEKKRFEESNKLLEEQVAREKQLAELAAQNKITAVEANCAQTIEEAKSKLEAEKRKIYTYAADEFKRFCCPLEHIDDRSYRSLISKVKKELDRLTESDEMVRRIAGAVPKQPTDEAVSKLISF
ncbi:hypothetical protein TRFO_20206 [Tritrichomonas foetus]|uniref:Uncharacterized protein n=1 Tax=Tritrichomonas foetus TaxID=1144522 RepID=A0A1J4KL00_9EUKA|nr:hypothetical protein TRFO_20206 [Tritrichomonas foetus]|eukprot:OHT10468.1 hypothetical protein TRFO_20206 [Tritrichomonas foetus]